MGRRRNLILHFETFWLLLDRCEQFVVFGRFVTFLAEKVLCTIGLLFVELPFDHHEHCYQFFDNVPNMFCTNVF